tara:strand:+ start:4036 stop:5058 length:1023 start_codon:yes stop_codon:yes gene_type:complete
VNKTLKGQIELCQVEKWFEDILVIKPIDLKIEAGEFLVFVGPSGSGKSTLLRMIAGLEDVSAGRILIDGQDMTYWKPAQRKLSMVFQNYALYPHMTVRQNLAFPLKMARIPVKEQNLLIEDVANTLGILPFMERKPTQLSGGQRQRVAIGRAIVRKPRAFLFDEPLSSLDTELRVNMRLEIASLHRKLDTTMIYVTHDQVEAMTLADRIIVLNNGEIGQVGTPDDLYKKPVNIFVAGFIGSPKMNFVNGYAASEFEAYQIGIRPEHLQLDKEKGQWLLDIVHYEDLGSESYVYLRNKTIGNFTVRCDSTNTWEIGNSVYITPQLEHLHRFDESGNRINKY